MNCLDQPDYRQKWLDIDFQRKIRPLLNSAIVNEPETTAIELAHLFTSVTMKIDGSNFDSLKEAKMQFLSFFSEFFSEPCSDFQISGTLV